MLPAIMQPPAPEALASLAEVVADPARVFIAHACVRGLQEGRTRQGRPFLDLTLCDASRVLAGKIWDDVPEALEAGRALTRGQIVKVMFRAELYQGALQLSVRRIRPAQPGEAEVGAILGEGHEPVADVLCRALVFDIETVPCGPRGALPEGVAKALDRFSGGDDGAADLACSLSPLLGKVVSLAFADGDAEADESAVTVLAVPPPGRSQEQKDYPPWLRPVDEPALLRAFWVLASQAAVVVSYNGRNFDVPFLVNRSLLHGVPARVDLLGNPYNLRPHLDLYRLLQPGRALGPAGLDVLCWALGLESPKGTLDGSQVAPTYARGDIEAIAAYNRGDVKATVGVYQRVRDTILRYRQDW
jgi:hypothetical protein